MQHWIDGTTFLVVAFIIGQLLYSATFAIDIYLFSLPVNRVKMAEAARVPEQDYPDIVLFYPVLRELESTMRTTMLSISQIDYPAGKARIIALPNADDLETTASLRRLQSEFEFLEILLVPPTTDPSWELVWQAWESNDKCYWWHAGRRRRVRELPPKKTRQLIYAFYQTALTWSKRGDFLVNYIDADSCPPQDHFVAAVAGMQSYDVLQSQNVAGNLNSSLAASLHAFDHMAWDGLKYAHLSANGRQPFWVLGKGLFFRASDLLELGGFHPWITIEDPEVGMRFWKNGKRLGIIGNPLIEEVPLTFARGVTQRKRWVCGFFQSLTEPLDRLGFTAWERMKAWMNFLPCLSLWVNAVGFPTGVWAIWSFAHHEHVLPLWIVALAGANVLGLVVSMTGLYLSTWRRTALVATGTGARVKYMLRVNPLFVAIWWVMWLVPLWIGFWMYLNDRGQVWERTEKINANKALIELNLQASQNSHHRAA
ncbi:MAG: glycosyl transferase, group 2 family protein [Phenylobacterium sp.]|nr:glycosyl transferase, group 2 family protein [Phenylobacterium sp.]